MLLNKAYYHLKPLLPWQLRIFLRRQRAIRRRRDYAAVWPIDPRSGRVPPGWPGWPEGKRFALVLTHDVEGSKGLQRVEQLMHLELKYGFRSSFNFVPKGEYCVPDGLRQTLLENGFEVGVHGLEHDGKLYSSKAEFVAKATQIKEYAQAWNAAGFRSPLMQHRLGWLHELGVEYDASTFDTDPFEPEPDGTGTIFPFWVPGPHGGGFVELPYTLPQDFALFSVLREPNIEIWKQKTDWIAAHGGMALLNTHPDYMAFDGAELARDEYPVSQYEQFLSYLSKTYEGEFWSTLPRDVTRFYCATIPPGSRNSRKKICMLAYTHYEMDNRVRRYAEALVKRGDNVEVIALANGNAPLGVEEIDGVRVFKVQQRTYNEQSKWTYFRRLLRFLWTSSNLLRKRHYLLNYDLIHVHNVPDFLVFAAWYPKLTGTKIILDIHDIVPELFASKFKSRLGNAYFSLLKRLEKVCTAFANHVIVANHLWRAKLISRCVSDEKCSVFLNHVDQSIFYRRRRTRTDGKFIVLFPGSLQWHQGLDIAIEAMAILKEKVPNAELHLYSGAGSAMERELRQLVAKLGLGDTVKFNGSLPLDKMPEIIANADLGIVPKRADSFGNEAYSTKILEFMSQGVPVVVSSTKIDTYYFNEGVVHFFPSGDSAGMAKAMLDVIENPTLREQLVEAGLEYVNQNSWDDRRRAYFQLVDGLCASVDDAELKASVSEEPHFPDSSLPIVGPLEPEAAVRAD
jgi:glycosyltransferase involved in cell wall biosynthesis